MTDKVEKQEEAMLPDDNVYTLSSGDTLEVKPLSWGKEIKVCKLVAGFLSKTDLLSTFNSMSNLGEGEEDSIQAFSEMILPLINDAPDAITKIVALITDKDTTFIEESLTSEDVLQVFIPFLKGLFNKYTAMFKMAK